VMRAGQVVQVGSPAQVYQRPVDADTARFIGEAVILDGHVVSHDGGLSTVDCALGQVTAPAAETPPPGSSCGVLIRPENLALGEGRVPARVVASTYFGHDLLVTLRLGTGGGGPEVRSRMIGARIPEPGVETFVRVSGLAHILPG
ncbi:MAG TPA: TOBE domain-containing protein, partial [Mycobacteriales bacterium]|nr:TOBE domain-containing protein [Mycobacteriales bacterium]